MENVCLAEHYSSKQGYFSHYIIWNEVANGDWFDASPLIDSQHAVSDADTDLWLDMCAAVTLQLPFVQHVKMFQMIVLLHRLGPCCHVQMHKLSSTALLDRNFLDTEDLSTWGL
jgi:hypothetical protein